MLALGEPYRFATVQAQGLEIETAPMDTLGRIVHEIARIESPVHVNDVVRRIRDGFGLNKLTTAQDQRVAEAIVHATVLGVRREGDFVTIPSQVVRVRSRADFPSSHKRLALIAPAELEAAVLHVAERSCGVRRSEIAENTATTLGFRSRPLETDALLEPLIDSLIAQGALEIRHGFVHAAERH